MGTDRILSQILGSGAASGFAGGLAGGLASGLLTSKAGRKFGKKALKVGGIAAVGGVAYAAFQKYREGQAGGAAAPAGAPAMAPSAPSAPQHAASPAGAPALERFVPESQGGGELLAFTLIRAMAAAAQADGKLDGAERHAIYERVGALDLSEAEKATLLAHLGNPVDLNELVAAATSVEIAVEIYTASLLAIEVDTAAERAYLAMLAARLELPAPLVASIHQEVGVPAAAGAAAAAPPPRLGVAS